MGISVVVTPRMAAGLEVGQQCLLVTHLVVREDSLTLYGFADVGSGRSSARCRPYRGRTAAGADHALDADRRSDPQCDRRRGRGSADDRLGVGRKGAQRIIVDLKDRLGVSTAAADTGIPSEASWRTQVSAALTGLGWSARRLSRRSPPVAQQPDSGQLSVPEALRRALQILDRSPAVSP